MEPESRLLGRPPRAGRALALWLAFVPLAPPARGQAPLINEVMASNGQTIRDEDGQSPDWIEIHNPGSSPLDLGGYGLTDGADPFRWVFPSVHVLAGGHLVVFASGKDRRETAPHWETVIDEGDPWRYIVPTSEPDSGWRSPGFEDSAWTPGVTGIGYGDGDDATIVPTGTLSVYARKVFQVSDPDAVSRVLLDIDFDDGFVAYVNGVEVARENVEDHGRPPAFDEGAVTYTEPRRIHGDPLWHYEIDEAAPLLRAGENVLAIQVHNHGTGSSDLTMIPLLTLGLDTVPEEPRGAADLVRSYLPQLHTSFKIDSDGEVIGLTSPDGEVIDAVRTGAQRTDISLGRSPDGSPAWRYHLTPTPGRPNLLSGFEAISGRPALSPPGGWHPAPVSLDISAEEPGASIHYTLDGSVPTTASPLYVAPIDISSTTVVRARILDDRAVPGPTETRTFFIDDTVSLPVVSVASAPENFFDREIGIYVLGDDYEPSVPYHGANFWQDWERPVHVALLEPDGSAAFRLDAGVKVFGGWSRAHEQRSLSFFARRQYGASEFDYRIFPTKPIDRFEAFVLRNSGNDWQRTHFRDALMTSLLGDLEVDRQAYRPAVMYINGEYWGIMNLREKINEHFIASNHPEVDEDAVDLLEWNGSVIHGDSEHYGALIALLEGSDVSDPAVYAQVREMVDVENFIDYQAAQIYFDNTDWPGNNIKYWRPRTEDGRWRWIVYDTDFGFGLHAAGRYSNDTLSFALQPDGTAWPNPAWSTFIFRRLVTNEAFVEDFVNRFATHLDTVFRPEKVLARIDEMVAPLEPEMARQRARFGKSVSAWRSDVETLRTFARFRPSYVRGHLASRFGLGGSVGLGVTVAAPGGGHVEIHGRRIAESPWSGTFFHGFPIRLEAVPHPGFRFVGWDGVEPSSQPVASIVPTGLRLDVTARFELDCEASGDVVIHEINYNGDEEADPGDWVEIHNRTPGAVDLSGWTLRDGSDEHVFTVADGTSIEGFGHLVLCSDRAAFAARFPSVEGVAGDLGFSLAGGGEWLRLADASGALIDEVEYDDVPPWPGEPDGGGATLALVHPALDNSYGPHWAASPDGGTPGARNLDVYREIDSGCSPGSVAYRRGDTNGDGSVDLSDAIATLLHLFARSGEPDCLAALDIDGDAEVHLTDAVALLTHLFRAGPPPASPYPHCGFSRSVADGGLGCRTPTPGCE